MDKDETFRHEYWFKKRAIKELYSNENQKIMLERLEQCRTVAQMDNLMVWGRLNLMKGGKDAR